MAAALPLDACAFPRPFPADFDECAVYAPGRYVPADSRQQPLRPIGMCGHLTVQSFNRRGTLHHDGACDLGDVTARMQKGRERGRK
jgi:hypothetical protein